MKRYPETVSKAERARVAMLRQSIPDVPEGWVESPKMVQRLNSTDAPGIFSLGFVSGELRVAFIMLPPDPGRVQISMTRNDADPSDEDIALVARAWFSAYEVEAMPPAGPRGLVFFRILGPGDPSS